MASTALYQIWAGTKQKELGAGSMQVLASSGLDWLFVGDACTLASVLSLLLLWKPQALACLGPVTEAGHAVVGHCAYACVVSAE